MFNKLDIFSVMENQKKALRAAILAAPEPTSATLDEAVTSKFVSDFEINAPILDIPRMELEEEEVDIDVSRDPRRYIRDSSRPFHIKGTRIVVHVPFTGDRELFDVRPSTYALSPPRGTVDSVNFYCNTSSRTTHLHQILKGNSMTI